MVPFAIPLATSCCIYLGVLGVVVGAAVEERGILNVGLRGEVPDAVGLLQVFVHEGVREGCLNFILAVVLLPRIFT